MKKILDTNIIEKFNWIYSRIFCLFFTSITQMIIKKDKNLFLFGCKPEPYLRDYFIHNSKYLFLYLQQYKNINTIWLCDDKNMIKKFHSKGYKNVVSRHSIKGILSILKAKYWFCDITANQITRFNSSATDSAIINFWHGTGGLKKSVNDINIVKKGSVIQKIYDKLKVKYSFYNVDSEHEIQFRKSQFGASENEIIIKGSPRLDALYSDIKDADLFMENDYKKIKEFKNNNKKLFIYAPTFRDTRKDISSWLKSENLNKFLTANNAILICKLHPRDVNSLIFELPNNIYKFDSTSDIYPVLKYTDCLISDYSSIYFDYLLLDKPIIYHVPDLEEYQEQCRGFYEPYENLTAGIKTKTEDEVIAAMQEVVNGIDNYKEDRKRLRDQTFKFQDGKNCERVFEWIKSLG